MIHDENMHMWENGVNRLERQTLRIKHSRHCRIISWIALITATAIYYFGWTDLLNCQKTRVLFGYIGAQSQQSFFAFHIYILLLFSLSRLYERVRLFFFSGRSWSETDDCFICARRESMSSMFSSLSLYSMDDDVAVVDDWKCVRNSFALFPSTTTLCLYCERKKCILSFGWRKRRGGKLHSDFYDSVWCLMQHAIYAFLCAFMAMPLMTRI